MCYPSFYQYLNGSYQIIWAVKQVEKGCNIKAIEKLLLLLLLLLFYIEGWIVFLQRQRLEVKSDENKNDTIWNFQQK